jgi:hypothetical protein
MGSVKPEKAEITVRHRRELNAVKIVSDALISARGVQGGRLLPIILVDTTDRPDVAEFIRIHQTLGPGDVTIQWGNLEGKEHKGSVALFLTFVRPMEFFLVIGVDVLTQGYLVEQILIGRGLYLSRADGEDDRFVKNPARASVLIEVPDTGFVPIWEQILHDHLFDDFRKRGLGRQQARQRARSMISEWRQLGTRKLRDGTSSELK